MIDNDTAYNAPTEAQHGDLLEYLDLRREPRRTPAEIIRMIRADETR